jgi:hypothetical protein
MMLPIVLRLTPWFVYPKILATGGAVHGGVIIAAAAESSSDNTLKVSLIAAVALVLAAAVPNLIALFKKPDLPPPPTTPADERLVATLEKAVEVTRNRVANLLSMVEERDQEIDRLQRMIVKLGGDPFPPVPLTEESQI